MPPRRIFKLAHSEIESEGIFNNICSYSDNSYISCTHIIAMYLLIYNYFNQRCYRVTFTDLNDLVTH